MMLREKVRFYEDIARYPFFFFFLLIHGFVSFFFSTFLSLVCLSPLPLCMLQLAVSDDTVHTSWCIWPHNVHKTKIWRKQVKEELVPEAVVLMCDCSGNYVQVESCVVPFAVPFPPLPDLCWSRKSLNLRCGEKATCVRRRGHPLFLHEAFELCTQTKWQQLSQLSIK